MAGAGWDQGSINHSGELSAQLGALLEDCTVEGDVLITCQSKTFPCHKAILAARSKYFRALLYGGMRESNPGAEIQIHDVEPETFAVLREYLYTCRMSLNKQSTSEVLLLLELAHRYELTLLEADICSYLRTQIDTSNAAEICQLATFYNLTTLQEHCLQLIDTHPSDCLSKIEQLSLHTLSAIFSRDSYPLPELEIFRVLHHWITSRHPSESEQQDLLASVRLCLIPPRELFLRVAPTGLFSSEAILGALREQTLTEHVDLPHRGVCREGVELVEGGVVSVVSGENGQVLFGRSSGSPVEQSGVVGERVYCKHQIGDERGITLRFGTPHIVNEISFLLPGNNKESNEVYSSYKVSISLNGESWKGVADYGSYHCHGQQRIQLREPRAVGWIRIVGTWCSTSKNLCIEEASVRYLPSVDVVSVDPNGVIEPRRNVATIERGAIVVEGVSKYRSTLLNGNTTQYDWEDGYTCHQVGSGAIIVLLPQPYLISSLSMLLWDCDNRCYSYVVSVSKNRRDWVDVVDHSRLQCSSWQHLTFPRTPTSYIRVIGTQNSANSVFHLIHMELPSHRKQCEEEEGEEEEEGVVRPHSSAASAVSRTETGGVETLELQLAAARISQ